jgi:hypothetical protein
MHQILSYLPIIPLILSIPLWFEFLIINSEYKGKGEWDEKTKVKIKELYKKLWILIGIFVISGIITAIFS